MRIDKNVIMGYALIVLFYSIGVDAIDHAFLWLFGVKIGFWFSNILFYGVSMEGRNLHTIYFFALYGVVLSLVLCAFVLRHKQPYTCYEVKYND